MTIPIIRSDDNDPLFNKENMMQRSFTSDYRQIRYYTMLIMQDAAFPQDEQDLLQQQISEIIKNAIKHGNHCDTNKKITVWYSFSPTHAHIIVEDQGEGFKELDAWNEFNAQRLKCLETQDYDNLAKYISFKTAESDEQDSGNALFAALEFWDGGFVFNTKRNAVSMLKKYTPK